MVISVCSGTRLNVTDISIAVTWPFLNRKESFSPNHIFELVNLWPLVWFIPGSLPLWYAAILVKVEHEVQHVNKQTCEKEKGSQMQMSIRYVSRDSQSNWLIVHETWCLVYETADIHKQVWPSSSICMSQWTDQFSANNWHISSLRLLFHSFWGLTNLRKFSTLNPLYRKHNLFM